MSMQDAINQKMTVVPEIMSAEKLVRAPLYAKAELTDELKSTAWWLMIGGMGQFDSFCVECEKESVFHVISTLTNDQRQKAVTIGFADQFKFAEPYAISYRCSRNGLHKIVVAVLAGGGKFIKIGQWPSLADIAEKEIRKYRSILGDERFREFSKGVGLFAHGVGIGAFVYPRRIFESVISDTLKAANEAGAGIDEAVFRTARMEDKIEFLKAHLPPFMVENKTLYGIVSKGIHELTEEECLAYFDTVRKGIEVILDQRIYEAEQKKRAAEAATAINNLHAKLKS